MIWEHRGIATVLAVRLVWWPPPCGMGEVGQAAARVLNGMQALLMCCCLQAAFELQFTRVSTRQRLTLENIGQPATM